MIPDYLVQNGTGRLYKFTERLMRRGDMVPCTEDKVPIPFKPEEIPGTPEHDAWLKEMQKNPYLMPEGHGLKNGQVIHASQPVPQPSAAANAFPEAPAEPATTEMPGPPANANKAQLLDYAHNTLNLLDVSDTMKVSEIRARIHQAQAVGVGKE